MGFINWLNLKRYIKKGTDAEVARIGHVNAVYDAATSLLKVDSLNGLQGNVNLTGADAILTPGRDWGISIEESIDTPGDLNISVTKPYSSLYMIVTPDEVPSVSISYTDITFEDEPIVVNVTRNDIGNYTVNFPDVAFDPGLTFINVYINTETKVVIAQRFTGSDIIYITYQGDPTGGLTPTDFPQPVYIEFKVFQ